MKLKKILSGIMALFIVFTTIVSANTFSNAEETHKVHVVIYNKEKKKTEPTVGELSFIIKQGYPLKKIGEFTSKDGVAEIPELKEGNYNISLNENPYYTTMDIFLTVEDGVYSFDDEEDVITVEKKKGVVIPSVQNTKKISVVDDEDKSITESLEFIFNKVDKFGKQTKIGEFATKDGILEINELDEGNYSVLLKENEKYEIENEDGILLSVKNKEYTFDDEVNKIKVIKKEIPTPKPTPIEPMEKSLLVYADNKIIKEKLSFEVLCDGIGKTVQVDNNGSINFEVFENKTYTIKLLSNENYEMKDIVATCTKETNFMGVSVPKLIDAIGKNIESLNLAKKQNEKPIESEVITKALLVKDDKNATVKDIYFEISSDLGTKTIEVDKNGSLNIEVLENKIYTIKLISNENYEMKDITFTCKKGTSDFGTPIYKLMNGENEISSLVVNKKSTVTPIIGTEITFDVLCGSCGNVPIAKELSFEVIGKDGKNVYKSNSGIIKFRLLENEKYTVKLIEDSEYEFSDVEFTVKNINGKLSAYSNDDKVVKQFVMKKKSNTGTCVESVCDFSDKKITMAPIPVKVFEYESIRDLKDGEEVIFDFYNTSKGIRVGEVRTVNGKIPALEVFEKDDYILFTSTKNTKFIMSDIPFKKEMTELYFMSNGDGNLPIRHKAKNPYAEGTNLNIVQLVVRPLESGEKIKEKYTIDYVRIKQDKANPQDYSKVKIIFTSEYDTVEATVLEEDEWGVLISPIELYENTQYSIRVEDPENKFAIENFPFTLIDKSERGPNHPLNWGDAKYVFDHSSCSNATFLKLIKKGTENDNNTSVTCSNGNTTITGMNFKDLMLRTIRPDKSIVKGLEGKDFDVFSFKLINPKRCEVSKIADGNLVIHRTIADGKIVKNVYQINKDGSLKELAFKQNGNVVDINTKTLSIYDTVIEYTDKNNEVDTIVVEENNSESVNHTTEINTWEKVDGTWYYRDSAEKDIYKNAWGKIDNVWYRFDEAGKMLSNTWFKDTNGRWYWLESSGAMSENEWIYVDGNWFWAYGNGIIAENEWVYVGDKWYYAKSGGYIVMNQDFTVNGVVYSFDENGAMK